MKKWPAESARTDLWTFMRSRYFCIFEEFLKDCAAERIFPEVTHPLHYYRRVKISDFDYFLPPELIAQHPAPRREEARLMVVDRHSQSIRHSRFAALPQFISDQDLVVLNDTRVFPARLYGRCAGRQGRVEVLLLQRLETDVWEALARPGKRFQPGVRVIFEAGAFEAEVLAGAAGAKRCLRFHYSGGFDAWLERLGRTPLPPYIRRARHEPDTEDRERYQTVFAQVQGSVAAPTAGLHFTPQLIAQIPHCEVTLHVGYGTFQPVGSDTVEAHRMEREYYEVTEEAARRIEQQRLAGKKIMAVGTTTTRVLESVFARHGQIRADRGWTDLFIFPGCEFKVLSGLITNFHLPRSTLLLLVSAFAGKSLVEKCYREAVEQKYRFYSYGDAMLIL